MALLLGVCSVAMARATPNYSVVQRGPYTKEGMDFSQVADVIAAHSGPGDLSGPRQHDHLEAKADPGADGGTAIGLRQPRRPRPGKTRHRPKHVMGQPQFHPGMNRPAAPMHRAVDRDGPGSDAARPSDRRRPSRRAAAHRGACLSSRRRVRFPFVERSQFGFAQVLKSAH
jgi:mannosyltransferase